MSTHLNRTLLSWAHLVAAPASQDLHSVVGLRDAACVRRSKKHREKAEALKVQLEEEAGLSPIEEGREAPGSEDSPLPERTSGHEPACQHSGAPQLPMLPPLTPVTDEAFSSPSSAGCLTPNQSSAHPSPTSARCRAGGASSSERISSTCSPAGAR